MFFILLIALSISHTFALESKLYGGIFDPVYFNAYQNKPLLENLTLVDFPVIKINLRSAEDYPIQCRPIPSSPGITKTSTYSYKDEELLEILPIDKYIYLFYKNLSVNVLENVFGDDKIFSEVKSIQFLDEHLSGESLYNDIVVLFLQDSSSIKIIAGQEIIVFGLNTANGNIKFTTKYASSLQTLNKWVNYQVKDGFLYVTYEDQIDRILKIPIEDDDQKSAVSEIILPSSPNAIILDFAVSDDSNIYILEANNGVHIYNGQLSRTAFIQEANGRKIYEKNQVVIIITEETQGQYTNFGVIEYIKAGLNSTLFIINDKKAFPGKFEGVMDIDSTRVLLLNRNIMFAWYHSITSDIQIDKQELTSSFIFNGEGSFFRQSIKNHNVEVLYTQLEDEIRSYKVFDSTPQIYCSEASLEKSSSNKISFDAVLTGATCSSKIQNNDISIQSLCLYHQDITITRMTTSSVRGTVSLWIVIVLGLLLFGLVLGVLIYYLKRYKSDSLFFRDTLGILKRKIDKITIDERPSSTLLKEMSEIVDNAVLLTDKTERIKEEGEEEESKENEVGTSSNKNNFLQILPSVSTDEIMKSSSARLSAGEEFLERNSERLPSDDNQ